MKTFIGGGRVHHGTPNAKKPHTRTLTYTYKTAQAGIFIDKSLKVLSVTTIENSQEGNGAASKLVKLIEGYARQCRLDEVWYPMVLNFRLIDILMRNDYRPVQYKHQGEDVTVFKKTLKP